MAVVPALLCCCGTVSPCDCGLSSVLVTWSGSIEFGYKCCLDNPFTPSSIFGTAKADGATITATKAATFNCPFNGETVFWSPLYDCITGDPINFEIGVAVIASIVFSRPGYPDRWSVSISFQKRIRVASTGASVSVSPICSSGGASLFDSSSGASVCPNGTTYSLDAAPTCSPLTSPAGEGSCLSAGWGQPGVVDFEVGGVSVS